MALAFLFPFPTMEEPADPLNELKYNPHGLKDLHQYLGALPDNGIYKAHHSLFDAADIAWIATTLGLASSTAPIDYNNFPLELITLRDGMPKGNKGATERAFMRSRIQKLVFNVVSDVLLIVIFLITYVDH